MSEPIDEAARRAWQGQAGVRTSTAIGVAIGQRLARHRRRIRRFWASAAIIVPGWMTAFWLYPDLRPVAAVGLMLAGWLSWQIVRRDPGRRSPNGVGLPCAAHERAVLARERDFYLTAPRWYLAPVLIGQAAIVATLLTSSRIERNAIFAGWLSAFLATVIVVLTVAFRRARRIVRELELEIIALDKEGAGA